MAKKKKIVIIIVAVILCAITLGGYGFMRSLGAVTTPKFEKIAENTYAYSESLDQSSIYLVVGSEKAMIIDTGHGLSDLPTAIREITDLPVIVVNTHGHYDHTRGNHYFEEVYMSVKDDEVFKRHNKSETVLELNNATAAPIRFLMQYQVEAINAMPINENYLPLPEEGYFDLGGRRLEIIELPGHTPGSIGLIDVNTGTLFSGDAITATGLLLNLEESLPVLVQKDTLLSVKELADSGKITAICGGHGTYRMGTEILQTYLDALDKILSGDLTEKERSEEGIDYEGLFVDFDLNRLNEK